MIVDHCIDIVAHVVVYNRDIVWLFALFLIFIWRRRVVIISARTDKGFFVITSLSSIWHTKCCLRLIGLPIIIFQSFLRGKGLFIL